jgi:hypothetical protein
LPENDPDEDRFDKEGAPGVKSTPYQTSGADWWKEVIEYEVNYYQGMDPEIQRPEGRPTSGLDKHLSDYDNDPLMILYARVVYSENSNYGDPEYRTAASIVTAWIAKNRLNTKYGSYASSGN